MASVASRVRTHTEIEWYTHVGNFLPSHHFPICLQKKDKLWKSKEFTVWRELRIILHACRRALATVYSGYIAGYFRGAYISRISRKEPSLRTVNSVQLCPLLCIEVLLELESAGPCRCCAHTILVRAARPGWVWLCRLSTKLVSVKIYFMAICEIHAP
jgi:hypothetical protein